MPDLMNTVLDIATLPDAAVSRSAWKTAQLSLFDWLTCGIAGVDEPLAGKLRALAEDEQGAPVASIFAGGHAPARMAALVNGSISHALDYDDTHFAHLGHLSVGIFPAALAAGEAVDAPAEAVVTAFLLGAEAAIRIGTVLGAVHYNLGFHQTATAGAFGATVAAGRLIGLDRDQMRAALGLCATRASGLKSQFGTMGKPYNAGIAASNGIECAKLAALGMTSCDDGLMGAQGFVPTHSPEPGSTVAPADQFLFGDVSYKFHACCHGTHAMIEALNAVKPDLDGRQDQITALTLRTSPRWLRVCDIPTPRTGLEVKFSYRWLAGMVLAGQDTGAFDTYSDAIAADPGLATFADKVTVVGDDSVTDMQAEGEVVLADGTELRFAHDLAQPIAADVLETRLRTKATAVLGDRAQGLHRVLDDLANMRAADLGTIVRTGHE